MPQDPIFRKAQPESRTSPARAVLGWALLAVILAAPLWHLHLITRIYLPANHSDLLPIWSGTRAALAGKDPYSGNTVVQMQRPWYAGAPKTMIRPEPQEFWYPGQTVVLFAPFAGLLWTTERLLYVTVVPPLLALSFWLAANLLGTGPSLRRRLLVVAIALFSWPVIWGVRLQQMSVVVALMIFIAWYLLLRGKQISAGVLLAIATIKPQLVAPLLVWLLFWAVVQRRRTLIASFAGSLATLLALAEWIMPGWIPHWLAAIRHYREVTHSSPQLETAFGHWAGLALGVLALVAVAVAFVRLRNVPRGSRQFNIAVALALAAAVLISPFNPPIIYNYVVLLPALLLILFHKPANRAAAVLRIVLAIQVAIDIFAPVISVVGESLAGVSSLWTVLPFLDFLLPSLATVILLLEVWSMKAQGSTPAQADSFQDGLLDSVR